MKMRGAPTSRTPVGTKQGEKAIIAWNRSPLETPRPSAYDAPSEKPQTAILPASTGRRANTFERPTVARPVLRCSGGGGPDRICDVGPRRTKVTRAQAAIE